MREHTESTRARKPGSHQQCFLMMKGTERHCKIMTAKTVRLQ